jgi:hypothetical protein
VPFLAEQTRAPEAGTNWRVSHGTCPDHVRVVQRRRHLGLGPRVRVRSSAWAGSSGATCGSAAAGVVLTPSKTDRRCPRLASVSWTEGRRMPSACALSRFASRTGRMSVGMHAISASVNHAGAHELALHRQQQHTERDDRDCRERADKHVERGGLEPCLADVEGRIQRDRRERRDLRRSCVAKRIRQRTRSCACNSSVFPPTTNKIPSTHARHCPVDASSHPAIARMLPTTYKMPSTHAAHGSTPHCSCLVAVAVAP